MKRKKKKWGSGKQRAGQSDPTLCALYTSLARVLIRKVRLWYRGNLTTQRGKDSALTDHSTVVDPDWEIGPICYEWEQPILQRYSHPVGGTIRSFFVLHMHCDWATFFSPNTKDLSIRDRLISWFTTKASFGPGWGTALVADVFPTASTLARSVCGWPVSVSPVGIGIESAKSGYLSFRKRKKNWPRTKSTEP